MSKLKRVAIIGTAGVPGKYGGFETLAHHLVKEKGEEFSFLVYCSTSFYPPEERLGKWHNARLVYIPFHANGVQSILYDICAMLHALFYAKTFLVLGVSGGLFLPLVRLFTNKRIIVNIDGLEWRRAKWSGLAKKMLKFFERLSVFSAHQTITDNKVIKDYASDEYHTESELIAYGGSQAMRIPLSPDLVHQYSFLEGSYAFKVCRIEPENNVSMILEAFSEQPELKLVIVGNWENSNYGRELKQQYAHVAHLVLLDPIYHQEKLDTLRSNCSIYIHGHSAGGTNPSLVEAMYLGLPILAYDVNFNRASTENKALYFSDSSDLINLLKALKKDDLELLASDMKSIADRLYTWKIIAAKYAALL